MDALMSLSGNVGTDIDFTTGDGWAFARFRLASTPRLRRYEKWIDGETTWINVRCSGRLADNVRASLAKGDPVVVVGKLRTHAWESNGERQERLVVEASSVGHDLTRGTTRFTKSEPAEPAAQDRGGAEPDGAPKEEAAGVEVSAAAA